MHWDSLETFSWFWIAGYSVLYSALVFRGEMSKDGPLIFSKSNARSARQIWIAHLLFLTILLALYRVAVAIDPHAPNWMSESAGRGGTWYESLFLVVLLVLTYIERKWLVVPVEDSDRNMVRERGRSEY